MPDLDDPELRGSPNPSRSHRICYSTTISSELVHTIGAGSSARQRSRLRSSSRDRARRADPGTKAPARARAGGGARGQPGDGRRRLPRAQAARFRRDGPRPRDVGRRGCRRCGCGGSPSSRRASGTWRAAIPTRASCPRWRRCSPASIRRTRSTASRPSCPELASLVEAEFSADGVRGEVAVTGGALDAIERALQTELRAGRPRRRRGPQLAADRRPRARARARDRARRRRPARTRPRHARRRTAARCAGRHRDAARSEPDRSGRRRCPRA